jgi:hypothetical protein
VIREAETWAAAAATQTITLSMSDQTFVYNSGWISRSQQCLFLPPGIRADVAAIPLPPDIPAPVCAGYARQLHSDVGQSATRQVRTTLPVSHVIPLLLIVFASFKYSGLRHSFQNRTIHRSFVALIPVGLIETHVCCSGPRASDHLGSQRLLQLIRHMSSGSAEASV